MELHVAVCSTDTLALPGVTSMIGRRGDVTVLPPERVGDADVALIVADEFGPGSYPTLSRVAASSAARVLLVVDRLAMIDVVHLARCRVVGVLPRASATADRLATAIAAAGRSTLDRGVLAARLTADLERTPDGGLRPRRDDPAVLTPRERDLVRLLADGYDTADVAVTLSYSERAVKHIVQRLLTRLELRNRAHVVAFAHRAGVL